MKTIKVSDKIRGIVFKDSALAHQYCIGHGIEIGPGAHNPFNLEDCFAVGLDNDSVFRNSEVDLCGSYTEIDIPANMGDLPLEDSSVDYVISSHAFEHYEDPVSLLIEWARVVVDGGVIFTIIPKRDALPSDAARPISTIEEVEAAIGAEPGNGENHCFVYNTDLFVDIVDMVNEMQSDFTLDVAELLETDDKVGNGHCIVLIVSKSYGVIEEDAVVEV